MSRTSQRIRAVESGWCQAGVNVNVRPPKKRYATIGEAWVDAFVQWAYFRYDAMTPYRCTAIKRRSVRVTIVPHPNPWSFRGWLALSRVEDKKWRGSCDGFHLTRLCYSILPGTKELADEERVSTTPAPSKPAAAGAAPPQEGDR